MSTNATPPAGEPALTALLGALGGPGGFVELALAVKTAREKALADGAALRREGRAGQVVAQASGDGRLVTLELPADAAAQDVIDAVNAALSAAQSAAQALLVASAESTPAIQELWGQRQS